MAPLSSGAKSGRKSTFVDAYQRTRRGNVPSPIDCAAKSGPDGLPDGQAVHIL